MHSERSQYVNKAAILSALTEVFVFIQLREKLGHKVLIKTAGDELSPKVSSL